MSLKAKIEAIIYAAEEPITLEQISLLLKDIVLAELASTRENLAIEQADSAAEAAASEAASSDATVSEIGSAAGSELRPDSGAESDSELGVGLGSELSSEPSSELSSGPDSELSSGENSELSSDSSYEAGELSLELAESPELSPEAGPLMPSEEPAPTASSEESAQPLIADDTAGSAALSTPESTSRKRQPKKSEQEIADDKAVRARVRQILIELITDYSGEDRGMEIRQVAGGFRMATKPEHHDVVRAFAKSLKPPIRLSLAALETLAVIAYKQPITGPEIADIRGVESASVLGTLLDRKLITTAGRKQVIGRPMQYKTSKDFLLRFGLNDVNELPSMEEFSQLASDGTIEITPADAQQTPSLFEPDTANSEQPDSQLSDSQPDAEVPGAQVADSQTSDSPVPDSLPEVSAAPQQPGTPEAANSQPDAEAEPSHSEAGHPIGHQ
jgi:segregation and condensation protein B